MADIFADDTFKCILLNETHFNLIVIDDKSSFVLEMVWCPRGNKWLGLLLFELMVGHFTDAYVRHQGPIGSLIRRRSNLAVHDDVIKWKHFPRYWPFVRGIHWSPVISPHKGQWRGASMLSLICVWRNGWVNNREAGDLRRHRAHYDVTVMLMVVFSVILTTNPKCFAITGVIWDVSILWT